jgi:hypothetical protein
MRPSVLLLACALSASACAGAIHEHRLLHPDAGAELRGAHRVAVLVDVEASTSFELGGILLTSPEEAQRIAASLRTAIDECLSRQGLEPVLLDGTAGSELDEAKLLYRVVSGELYTMQYGSIPSTIARPRFEYGVGDVASILERVGADHLLLVRASSARATTLFGLPEPNLEHSYLFAGLVGPGGRIVFFQGTKREGEAVFAGPRGTQRIVSELLSNVAGGDR